MMHAKPVPVRIWDLPTRLFHWLLAACVTGLIITGHVGGNAMVWHFRCGYAVICFLLFRLVWGVVGGRWSRFSSFLYSPRTVMEYLRGRAHPHHVVGHNPLGAGSVFALLLFLIAQVGTGLFSDDEIAFAGPLTKFVSGATVSLATKYHTEIGQVVLIALILLHVAAITYYYLRKKENLIKPMLSGDKWLAPETPASHDGFKNRALAALILGVSAALTWCLVSWGA
jgi:cytochrome b